MSYNPEKPQFWEPFSLSGEFVSSRRKLTDEAHEYFRQHLGFPYHREVIYGEYSDKLPIHDLIGGDGTAITRHVLKLRDAHPDIVIDLCRTLDAQPKEYRHTFIWRDGGEVMVDTWLSVVGDDSYPTSSVRVFRGLDEVDPSKYGHAGGNTLIALGAEELHRRKLARVGQGIAEFAHRSRDNMPDFEKGFIAYPRLRRW